MKTTHNKTLVLSFAAVIAVDCIGPVLAADMPVKARPMAPAPSWTGFYIGANGGGVWGQTQTQLFVTNNVPAFFALGNIPTVQAAGLNNVNNSGGLAGGQIGYLFQPGSIVAGFEASFDWTNLKGSFSNSGIYPLNAPNGFNLSGTASAGWLATFMGRVGYDLGSWLPYMTAGVAVANLKYTSTFTDPVFAAGCGTCVASISTVVPGFALGGGLEWRLPDSHWSVRGEYLYMRFNDVNGTAIARPGIPPGTANLSHLATFSENVARAAINYKY